MDINKNSEKSIKSRKSVRKSQGKRSFARMILNAGEICLQLFIAIIAWIALIVYIIIPIAPVVATFVLARFIERLVYWRMHGLEAVTGGDSVWLSNGPENPGIIAALLTFSSEMDLEKLKRRVLETKEQGAKITSNPYRRLTKKVSSAFLNYFWEDEENFDIGEHVKKWPETVKSKEEVRAIMSRLCALPFRLGMSQWEFVIIPWMEHGGKKSAVMFRVNHSLADGGSLMNYLTNALTDNNAEPVKFKKFTQTGRLFMSLKGALFSPIFVAKMLLSRSDSTILHGKPLSGKKVLTWSDPLSMKTMKKIKTATGTTLNDVLVACMTASIREFFISKEIDPPQDVKVSIPIDLRKNWDLDAVEFENRFAVLQLALPTGISDPLEQLYKVQSRMNDFKTSGEPFAVGPSMDTFLTILPTWIISPIFNFIVQKSTGVLSNVPGPQNPLTLAGCSLENMTFWAPPRGNLGMTFSITSYNEKICIGVQSDESILDNPDEICNHFSGQVQRLLNRLNLND